MRFLKHAQGSTLTSNKAVNNGGAVTCLSCGELSTQMTTFSNNTAAGGYGGGLECVLTLSTDPHLAVLTNWTPQFVHFVMALSRRAIL